MIGSCQNAFKVLKRIVFLSLGFVLFLSVANAEPSSFVPIKLPRGVEVQLPKGWWLLGSDYNQLIKASVEAALDLSGIGMGDGSDTNLIAANSMPRSTYASLRIDSTIPPSALPQEIQSLTRQDLLELTPYMEKEFKKLIPYQGNQLLDFYGFDKMSISGHPSLVVSYRRSGPKGPVIVEIITVYTTRQEVKINLAYRESEKALWYAVIQKIKQSLIVE